MADEAPLPSAAEQAVGTAAPQRIHLVVVTTRALREEDQGVAGAILRTRFWHPGEHRWSENDFETLEHAQRLFIDESGWVLRQQQALDAPHAFELVFEARREDFSRPSTEAMLQEVGLSPEDVAALMERVDREDGEAR
ncbi:MAG TPA: hypothetical protein VF046_07345 [Gemmatimonadales bacterium]